MAAKRHKDLEFHVESKRTGNTKVFRNFEEACVSAVVLSAATGEAVHIDVITWSRAAAKAWMGDDGGLMYDVDPEASVHERIVVRADAQGRVRLWRYRASRRSSRASPE